MLVTIDKFRLVEKGNFIASMDVIFEDIGMIVHGIKLMSTKDDKTFFSFPSEPFTASDGTKKYKNHVSFPDKEKYFSFQNSMSKALLDYNNKPKEVSQFKPSDILSGSNNLSKIEDELPF